MKRILPLLLILMFDFTFIQAQEIEHIEPPYWWVGMKEKSLQIMVHGPEIGSYEVDMDYPGVTLANVVKAESPNYLFIYLTISSEANPGAITLKFKNGNNTLDYDYVLKSRSDSDGVAGFDNSDVLYLLMPDRFSNGNPNNDQLEDVYPDRNNPNGRHGGDMRGVQNHLDYLTELGITTIWFNPVLENKMPGGAYHGYFTTDYYKIDPRFGTNEDYKELVKACHNNGIKVVMDVIINHIGDHHWWMKDLPFADWIHQPKEYVQTNHSKYTWMDTHAPKSEKDILINGWFAPIMPDLNQENPHLATYLIQNSIWWIEFSRVDGIRMDTYPYGDYEMAIDWCKSIYKEYPNFSIVGEGFYPKKAGGSWWQTQSKLNDESDTQLKIIMDFELCFTMQKAFIGDTDISLEASETGLYKLYETIAQDFLYAAPNNLLIFFDNHDISRFNKIDDKDLNKFKQAIAFLLTTRGIPQIYYGTELLNTGEKLDGDGGLRPDFPGGWEGDPVNAFEQSGRTPNQNEAWDYLQRLLHWRQKTPAIHDGKLIHYAPSENGVYLYARIKEEKTILVILNGKDISQTLEMKRFHEVIQNHAYGIDIISGRKIELETQIELPPKGVYILELNF